MKIKAKVRRKNKIANHYQLLLERNKQLSNNNELLQLAIYGTLDVLAKRSGLVLSLSKKVYKEHITDKGYYKQVYMLSDYGKKLLKNKKTSKLYFSKN